MEPEKFVIDSNIFVAFYYGADVNHANAVKVLADLETKILIVHPYVIQETATVLAYKAGRKLAVLFLDDLSKSVNIIIPFVHIEEDIKSFQNTSKKISFTDSALVGLTKLMNAQLVTFDRQLLRSFKD